MPTSVEIGPMVELLGAEWQAIDQTCAGLDEAQWKRPTCLPGWSVQDQLAHLVGIERMLLGEPAPEIDVSHLDHIRNDIGRMAEVWIEELRPLSGISVLERFRAVTDARLAALRSMSQEDFDAPSWTPVGKDETYGRFMRIRHYDCFLHEHDMRDALGVGDRPDREQLELVLDEVAAGLGYVVGKKAAMPAGARVRIEVTGEAPRHLDFEVAERAALVDRFDAEPTVLLRLPALLFLRLTGGRTDPEPHIGEEIELGGDHDLAGRLARNLAYTI